MLTFFSSDKNSEIFSISPLFFSENSTLSPIKHINNIRFEQAKALLLSSNLTIGEIASNVGFCDQFYFSKTFKSTFGISPSEYRDIKGEAGIDRYRA